MDAKAEPGSHASGALWLALGSFIGSGAAGTLLANALVSPSDATTLETFRLVEEAVPWAVGAVIVAVVVFALRDRAIPVPPARNVAVDGGDGLPRLAPLTCSVCGAPTPIAEDARCVHCGAAAPVPADYLQVLRTRALAASELARAIEAWRSAQRVASRPVIAACYLVAFTIFAIIATILRASGIVHSDATTSALDGAMLLSGLVMTFGLYAVGVYLVVTRASTPRAIPDATRPPDEPELTACSTCGGPITFAAGDLVVTCPYCGAEDYRVAFARRAVASSAQAEHRAATSLYDTMRELRVRRRGALLVFLGIVNAAVVFVAIAVAVTNLSEALGIAAAFAIVLAEIALIARFVARAS